VTAEPVVRTEGLGKLYRIARSASVTDGRSLATSARRLLRASTWSHGREGFWALRDVSFEVQQGEILGIVGANGAGKSTLLKILARITDPTEGRAEIRGRLGSLLEVGTGFHPELTGRDNVMLNGTILGMRRTEIACRFDEIVEFSGIERFLDVPVKFYSSGMYVRLAFSIAAHLDPEVLVVDEVLAVGDIDFQKKCLGRIGEVATEGRTIIFVSHNLSTVAALCTRAILIEHGRLVAEGEVPRVLERYVASTTRHTSVSLRERVDRKGSGRIRFSRVRVSGPAGPAVVGEDAEVWLEYESDSAAEPSNVTVSLAVYGSMGEPIFLTSTSVSGQHFARVPDGGAFCCSIPRLPLLPGHYSLNVYAEVNGLLADWIENAHAFEVVEGDYFGSGQLPPSSHGSVIVDHSWSVSADVDAPARFESEGVQT
jgi:lipopolysaccharide transport system ATP-binding protein